MTTPQTEYKCANCGAPCGATEEWSTQDAIDEMHAMWGEDTTQEDCDVVCDTCWDKFKAWLDATEGRA